MNQQTVPEYSHRTVLLDEAVDALAIAAQALIGHELGRGEVRTARALTRVMVRWSLWFGVVTGVLLGVLAWGLNDSGVSMPAMMLMIALPYTAWLALDRAGRP